MNFNLADYSFLGSVPLILALVQLFKGWVTDTRLYPLISVVMGIIINVGIAGALGNSLWGGAIMGIAAGLSAGGVYSTGSTLSEGSSADKAKR